MMDEFAGAYGDERRAAAVARLHAAMVERRTVVVRKLGGDRKGEVSAHLALASPRVTAPETVACLARGTARAVAGRRVVAAQDTTEVSFPGRRSRGLGPAGRLGAAPGFFVHAMGESALSPDVAVDAETEAVLGLVDAEIWTRHGRDGGPGTSDRRRRVLADKESRRWLAVAEAAAERLAAAAEVVVVGDRESDIYALFARRPERVHLLVRAAQDRALGDGGRLFAAAAAWPALGRYTVAVPPRGPGDRGRLAEVTLRAGPVTLRRPRNARPEGDPATSEAWLVEAVEDDSPPSVDQAGRSFADEAPRDGVEPLRWRLLTTLPVGTEAEAVEAVRLYRLRWRVEQTFRALKGDGLRLEEAQTHTPHRLLNLAALALGAAVRVIQLVDARGGGPRPASDAADEGQIAAAAALCPTLEGRTERQRNPHAPGSLAWLSWVVARLGGWNCYGKPPGPKTMHDGWRRFAAIAEGHALAQAATHDACIP